MTNSEQAWAAVPLRVQDLYIKYAADAQEILGGDQNHKHGWVLQTEEVGPVLLKRASEPSAADLSLDSDGAIPRIGEAWRTAQSYLGGPNPLTGMLLGGALGGGLGYGAGYLMNKLFPRAFTKRAPVGWGILGALGGAAIPGALHVPHALKTQGLEGMIRQQPLQGGKTTTAADSRFNDTLEKLSAELGIETDPEEFYKHAIVSRAGGHLPTIPTDEWGRVVQRDPVLQPAEKAVTAGLPAAAGAMRGSKYVSPNDVASVAANAGLGYGYGYLGSLAAKFLGLSEPVQQGLQRAGLLAGAVRGVTGML